MRSWQPLITDRAPIQALLGDLVAAMAAGGDMRAEADRALVRAYLAEDGVVADPDDASGEALAAAVGHLASAGAGVDLFGGAAGIGWTVAHLACDEAGDAVCSGIDAALLAELALPQRRRYDLISGLVGIGVYALERGAAGLPLAERVLDELAARAEPRGPGLAWHTSPDLLPAWQRELAPEGYWNFGMAHGMPGIIGFLARCLSAGVDAGRARRLLDGAVRHLLAAAPPAATGRYPSWQPGAPGREVAWCYGDLGVSLALLAAARAAGDGAWQDEALALARGCARRSLDAAPLGDPCLCHGAFGAAHLFNRLRHATGDELFAGAARRQIADGLPAIAQPFADVSLLGGAAGIALVLHAMVSEVEPGWDRLLLIDVAA